VHARPAELPDEIDPPEARARLTPQGFDPEASTPQHVTQYVKSEVVRYGKLLKSMGIQNL
jgi:tripartite-type tricarboxylate transporter receptor subunit TctC